MSDANVSLADRFVVAPRERSIFGLRRPEIGTLAIVGIFLTVCIAGGLTTSGFATADNARAILVSSAFVGVIAVGMTLIMISGNVFSLSLGLTAAVSAIAFLYLLRLGFVPALVLTMLLGGAICALQGAVVGGLGANPIIVTIAAGVVQQGLTLDLTGGTTTNPGGGNHDYLVLTHMVAGIPIQFVILVGLTLVADFMLRATRFGRQVYAVGENRQAARAAAISIPRVAIGAFAFAGVAAGLAGALLGAANQNATLSIASTFTYDAIAAALVGGTAVAGGRGSAARTLFGAVIIATISSILLLHSYSTGVQMLVKGVIVVMVVAILSLGDRDGS
ncbi:MAG: ribose transport system permease protein [Gaiellales bacterium]|jgi:ribose/xylose/arabinose/galactoside ABC-type transport system permease subunit|nr:ribose transport system permease protein [Gaiellales bacterium]